MITELSNFVESQLARVTCWTFFYIWVKVLQECSISTGVFKVSSAQAFEGTWKDRGTNEMEDFSFCIRIPHNHRKNRVGNLVKTCFCDFLSIFNHVLQALVTKHDILIIFIHFRCLYYSYLVDATDSWKCAIFLTP